MFAFTTKRFLPCALALTLPLFAFANEEDLLPPTIYPSEIAQEWDGYDVSSLVPMLVSSAAGSATIFAANVLTGGALLAPMIGAQSSALYGGSLLGSKASTLAAPLMDYSGVVTNSIVSGALYAGSFFAVSASLEPEMVGDEQ